MQYEGKKVAIAGYSIEGEASLKHWQSLGAEITILDDSPDVTERSPEGIPVRAGAGAFENLGEFDLVVRTPGINPNRLPEATITTQLREFLSNSPAKVIGITGTKGKGTTATLISKMLEAAGKKTWLVGNIGVAALSVLDQVGEDDVVVYEMSSFQLIDSDRSPDIAVVLPVGTDHLDYHKDREDYVLAKTNIAAHQTESNTVIYHATDDTANAIAETSSGIKLAYLSDAAATIVDGSIVIDGQEVIATKKVKLVGRHNLENACAAVTACWQFTKDIEAFRKVLSTFEGLEHRIEFVSEVDSVRYFNDSFATTPDSTIAAIRSFDEPKVLILGGSKKDSEFTNLVDEIKESNIRSVILIGQEGETIARLLEESDFDGEKMIKGGSTMTEIVEQARDVSKEGDVVLMSPACASFDMFESYKQRGELFKSGVAGLVT